MPKWTNDCQGKKDYDGSIISFSSRYYPGRESGEGFDVFDSATRQWTKHPYGERPSAVSSIGLIDSDGDYISLVEEKFEGDSQAEVQAAVEKWVAENSERVVNAVRAEFDKNAGLTEG